MDVRTAVHQASRLFEDAGVAAPRLTAEVLLAHALKRERSWLFSHSDEDLDGVAGARYNRSVQERLHGKPTQYILGRQEFYGRDFLLSPDVFIPRPETEYVVEQALKLAPRPGTLVDVGCGSGAIAVTISVEAGGAVQVLATDVSTSAILMARENAKRLNARVSFTVSDLTSSLKDGSLDMVVSNPPYIPLPEEEGLPREVRDYEPRIALFAGPEGLDVYQKLIEDARRVLKPGGWVVFELGYRQLDAVHQMLDNRWSEVQAITDLAGLPRVFAARWTP
jgi:release factor glutamine methyltransferase